MIAWISRRFRPNLWDRLRERVAELEPYDAEFAAATDAVEQHYRQVSDLFVAERSTPFTGEERAAWKALDVNGRCTCQVCSAGPRGLELHLALLDLDDLRVHVAQYYQAPEETR